MIFLFCSTAIKEAISAIAAKPALTIAAQSAAVRPESADLALLGAAAMAAVATGVQSITRRV